MYSWEKKSCGNNWQWKLCMSACIALEGVLRGRVCDTCWHRYRTESYLEAAPAACEKVARRRGGSCHNLA